MATSCLAYAAMLRRLCTAFNECIYSRSCSCCIDAHACAPLQMFTLTKASVLLTGMRPMALKQEHVGPLMWQAARDPICKLTRHVCCCCCLPDGCTHQPVAQDGPDKYLQPGTPHPEHSLVCMLPHNSQPQTHTQKRRSLHEWQRRVNPSHHTEQ